MIQFDSQFADGLETTNYFLTKSLVVEMLKILDNLGILECIKALDMVGTPLIHSMIKARPFLHQFP